MRIALFGGTFDPVHRGHLAIARAAAETFALDCVWFAPVGRQPLKEDAPAAGFSDRLAMVRLACAEDARFSASEVDAPRADGEPNYTVDALERLAERELAAERFAIAGADSFLSLPRWREPRRLLELAEWIVVSRPGLPSGESGVELKGELEAMLDGMGVTAAQRARVHVLATVQEDVSATELRSRLRAGERCEGMLPAAVAEYIAARRLYRQRRGL